MPIGLYRYKGCKDNQFPYVCTNPDPQTILGDKDKVFVLAQNTPSELSKENKHVFFNLVFEGAEWGAPFEKLHEKQVNKTVKAPITEDLLMNYDDINKDLKKNKSLLEENKKVFENIGKIINDLKYLKNETCLLYERLNNRQDYILEKVRSLIGNTLKSLLPENVNYIVYDNDDLKTGSSATSVDDEGGPEQTDEN